MSNLERRQGAHLAHVYIKGLFTYSNCNRKNGFDTHICDCDVAIAMYVNVP